MVAIFIFAEDVCYFCVALGWEYIRGLGVSGCYSYANQYRCGLKVNTVTSYELWSNLLRYALEYSASGCRLGGYGVGLACCWCRFNSLMQQGFFFSPRVSFPPWSRLLAPGVFKPSCSTPFTLFLRRVSVYRPFQLYFIPKTLSTIPPFSAPFFQLIST